jgi:hypothetical protein
MHRLNEKHLPAQVEITAKVHASAIIQYREKRSSCDAFRPTQKHHTCLLEAFSKNMHRKSAP